METIKCKALKIKKGAQIVGKHTDEKATLLWMAEIIDICDYILEKIDIVGAAVDKIKYLVR